MRNLFFLAVVLFFGILQAALPDYVKFFGIKPDLLLAGSISASLAFSSGWALFFSILCGLLKDIYGPGPLYINTLLFPFWSLLIIKFSRKVSLDYGPARCGTAFTIALLHNIFCCLTLIYLGKVIPLGISARITLISSLYTALVFPLIFKFTQVIPYCPPVQRAVSPQDE